MENRSVKNRGLRDVLRKAFNKFRDKRDITPDMVVAELPVSPSKVVIDGNESKKKICTFRDVPPGSYFLLAEYPKIIMMLRIDSQMPGYANKAVCLNDGMFHTVMDLCPAQVIDVVISHSEHG